jgi:hypothetical protein
MKFRITFYSAIGLITSIHSFGSRSSAFFTRINAMHNNGFSIKRKLLRGLILCIILCITMTSSFSQVIVRLRQPAPLHMNIATFWNVTLISNGKQPRSIQLYGTATESRTGRWIASGLSSPFTIPSGTTVLNGSEISIANFNADPVYRDVVDRTGNVPTGKYTICVYVLDAKTRDTLGRDCISEQVELNVTCSEKYNGLQAKFSATGQERSYAVTISNRDTIGDNMHVQSKPTPVQPISLAIKISGNSIISIDGAPKGWEQTPSKFQPNTEGVKWTNSNGIPIGKTKLGILKLANKISSSTKVTWEWLDKDANVLCKDSTILGE